MIFSRWVLKSMMHLNGNVWFPASGEGRNASLWLDYSPFIGQQQLLYPLILKWPLLVQSLAGHVMSSTWCNALLFVYCYGNNNQS